MRISPEYLAQNEQLHRDSSFYGASGHKNFWIVKDLLEKYPGEVLDYGCGKAGLKHKLGEVVRNYDPAVPEYSVDPEPADIVVCADVMEHIEPECVDDVLSHIQSLAKKAAYFLVALNESKKFLPDGRNTHICLRPVEWWDEKLSKYFQVKTKEVTEHGVRYVVEPLEPHDR